MTSRILGGRLCAEWAEAFAKPRQPPSAADATAHPAVLRKTRRFIFCPSFVTDILSHEFRASHLHISLSLQSLRLPFKPVQAVAQHFVITRRPLAPVASRTQPAAHVHVLNRNFCPSPHGMSVRGKPSGVNKNPAHSHGKSCSLARWIAVVGSSSRQSHPNSRRLGP